MTIFTPGTLKRHLVGTITAAGTSEVTITVPKVQEDTLILVSLKTAAGTPEAVYENSRNTTTGVVGFKSAASNTCVYNVYAFI